MPDLRSDRSRSADWRLGVDPDLGPAFFRDEPETRIAIDSCEWVYGTKLDGLNNYCKVTLADVVEIVPEFRDEAIGMTYAARDDERARLRTVLLSVMASIDECDDAQTNKLLDDLRSWGTYDLSRELVEVIE